MRARVIKATVSKTFFGDELLPHIEAYYEHKGDGTLLRMRANMIDRLRLGGQLFGVRDPDNPNDVRYEKHTREALAEEIAKHLDDTLLCECEWIGGEAYIYRETEVHIN